MGHMEPREEHYTHNIDSRQDQPIDKVINVIITERILIDDDHRALYMRNDSGSKFFYHMKNPLKHSLTIEKVLYVIFNRTERFPKSVTFIDTFGQEWDLLSDNEVKNFNHQGRLFNQESRASTSNKTSCLSQANPGNGVHTTPVKDTKPMGIVSMHDTSGNSANRGPTKPLHSYIPHKPSGASRKGQEMSNQGIDDSQAISKEPKVETCGDKPEKNKKRKKESWKEQRARRVASKKRQNEKEHSVVENQKQNTEPVPLDKQGDYYEGDSGNVMLPIEYAGLSIMAILDGGAGMAIITKEVWELWGKNRP